MALVDYASSEESEEETGPQPVIKAKNPPSKHGFQKIVDSSNPNKIRLNLANEKPTESKDDVQDERPTKKPKIEGKGLTSFNALLPAPKRPAATNEQVRRGLGRGVNLKTGATPGFTREPIQASVVEETQTEAPGTDALPATSPPETSKDTETTVTPVEHSESAVQIPTKKATMFKPLSVSRKPQKKKPPLPQNGEAQKPGNSSQQDAKITTPSPKVSLFSSHNDSTDQQIKGSAETSPAHYQPMLYQASHKDAVPPGETPSSEYDNFADRQLAQDSIQSPSNQDGSLDAIATSLNLTAAQKRQLLGRNASKSSSTQAIKVTNFNIDTEYASNEALRQAGETIEHQAVRPIQGGGKHSLKQLVSSAVGQKDALEEKFAEGTRNRKEGANKYGW